ncbi:hypothetical protein MIZ03_0246 [Rhodoferax lithotrophicus]|uniref:Uncharacterized protein n=1 Tax=Rhodoferax lithotrophicus TaxID=2798804 RepID=A0ABM7MGU5_9BURK|nr:hypothetical protein MIZ03_0246 [Rhodoferax sp. MIZ03]
MDDGIRVLELRVLFFERYVISSCLRLFDKGYRVKTFTICGWHRVMPAPANPGPIFQRLRMGLRSKVYACGICFNAFVTFEITSLRGFLRRSGTLRS